VVDFVGGTCTDVYVHPNHSLDLHGNKLHGLVDFVDKVFAVKV
jgi:hypothetical protein